ncbi:MAG TPA: M3 family oligoendopeptidase [Anaerolineaceae bacterium]|nr:M3 family oligoendopeptidase [Anaerolineaceae bacterium]
MAVETAVESLPRWNTTTFYPSLESRPFRADFAALTAGIDALAVLFDRSCIGGADGGRPVKEAAAAFEAAVQALNPLLEKSRTLRTYIFSFVATDSRDSLAQARMSEYQQNLVCLEQLLTRFTAWIGELDIEDLLAVSAVARDYTYLLRRAQKKVAYLMSPAEEDLAAELSPSGGQAWNRLYGDLTSQLTVGVAFPDGVREMPIAMVRNLACDPDPEIRRAGYYAELEGWKNAALPLAAALNSIKGEQIVLSSKRHWETVLDEALFNNGIDRETLEAMHSAVREEYPVFRRYLQVKARLLGEAKLPWWDLFAPLGQAARPWTFSRARDLIVEQFGAYSPRLGEFAEKAFREGWIDAEPREGKRDGAFCMAVRGGESRLLANFQPGIKSVLTLAHELGHAYHNLNLAQNPALNRESPGTLAETASIFCETLIRQAMINKALGPEKLALLDAGLANFTQQVVDVTGRFIFERGLLARRVNRELSVPELNELMLQAQRETYGDGLDADALHPYLWAARLHYYYPANPFYNFPYTFGLLFSLGLYARYVKEKDTFQAGFDNLLASTGRVEAASLARRMGIDIRAPGFWRAGLKTIAHTVDQFEELAEEDFQGM